MSGGSATLVGALVGGLCGVGLWILAARGLSARGDRFRRRVLVHLEDGPLDLGTPGGGAGAAGLGGPLAVLLQPALRRGAALVERWAGGSASIQRRLDRAGSPVTVHEFRVEQVTWALVAFCGSGMLAVLLAWRSPERAVPLAVLVLVVTLLGGMLRENRLSAQVRAHEQQVLAELPATAELMALAVAAGEGPVPALERVVSRSHGALSRELARVLAEVRTGVPLTEALDAFARRSGLPVVARLADAVVVSVERGTPLADVLHAQAADVREARRRALIESGARREIAMMVPVVFLVLPTTVLFAFWPGVVGLRLAGP